MVSTVCDRFHTYRIIELFPVVGPIPSTFCPGVKSASADEANPFPVDISNNPQLLCYPACLSPLIESDVFVPDENWAHQCKPSVQDLALCGIIDSSNVTSEYGGWLCVNGTPASNPCSTSDHWGGVNRCTEDGLVSDLSLSSLSGIVQHE